jgi:Xaa-Pro aminopeptidase
MRGGITGIFDDRTRRLRGILSAHGIDLAVIGPTSHMRYLIGGSPHADERLSVLFVDATDAQLVVPALNADAVASITSIPILAWEDAQGPVSALRSSFAARRGVGKLAVDGAMRADFLLPIIEVLGPAEIVSVDPLLSVLRQRKSPEEIEALARSAGQADRAVEAVLAAVKAGVTEKFLGWEAEKAFRSLGAERVTFTLIAFGANSAHPHHVSGEKALARGECVLIDIGASLQGYQSDVTRMAFLGEPPGEFLKVYGVVRDALRAGREAVKPGVPLCEVDGAARSVIEEQGYGDRFVHRTGHGIGLDLHEAPWVTAGNAEIVEEGMVFSVEPGVYLPGKFGVRIEDIVAAEPGGSRTLTRSTHELAVL